MPSVKGRQTSFKLLATILLWSMLSTLLLHRYVLAVYVIEGYSMAPTFNHGDMALVNMLARRAGSIKRGEIVLVRDGYREYATKRVVGLPGEVLEIRDHHVYVNGLALEEKYLPRSTVTTSPRRTFVLGPDDYFVMGDNRADSFDSRYYGPVRAEAIVGSYTKTFWACR
jgi:signal peptidase I